MSDPAEVDDAAWFAKHPERFYRLRVGTASERACVPKEMDRPHLEFVIIARSRAGTVSRGFGYGASDRVPALVAWFDAAPEPAAADLLLRETFREMAAAVGVQIDDYVPRWSQPLGAILQ